MQILDLNLLPLEHQHKRHDITWILDRRVVWPSILLLATLMTCFYFMREQAIQEENLNVELESANTKIAAQRPILNSLTETRANLDEIRKKNLALTSIQVSKQKWIRVFETVSSQLPPNTWLLSMQQGDMNPADTSTIIKSKELRIIANSHKFDEVASYMSKLVASNEIDSVSLKGVKSIRESYGLVYQMELVAYVNPFIGIDDTTKVK